LPDSRPSNERSKLRKEASDAETILIVGAGGFVGSDLAMRMRRPNAVRRGEQLSSAIGT
jgi:hypothetical protein